jgi:epoxide hydrolase-like predicted phosphatase
MIKAVIFDCFGVLIADGLEAIVLNQEKTDPSFRPFVHKVIGDSNRGKTEPSESHRRISERLGVGREDLQRQIFGGEARNQQVLDLIVSLRKDYKTALLSNVGKNSLEHRFSDEELSELFDAVVASGEVGFAKPDAEIYRHTASLLGVEPEECVFIDDREVYVAGAKQAGMQAILYTDFDQLKAELEEVLADPES